jgi:hypothetical protein
MLLFFLNTQSQCSILSCWNLVSKRRKFKWVQLPKQAFSKIKYLITFESGFTFNVIKTQSASDFNLVSTRKVHPACYNAAIHSYKKIHLHEPTC